MICKENAQIEYFPSNFDNCDFNEIFSLFIK
jgi:hypothetical protein